jgi:predicted negative regulator of RcsB-dependent stress response
MAAYDLEEQDQIDDLKAWWTRWGGTISTGLLIGALVIAGVQGWRWYAGNRAQEAAALYTALSEAGRKGDNARARDAVTSLEEKFASTGYAPRAALLYARILYDAGDRAGAKLQLQWAIDHGDEDELKAIARYRLAQAQVDERAFDQALATLDAKHPAAFDGLYADLRGDALAAADRTAEARAAYETAVAKLDSKSQYLQFVRVKLDALGGPAPQAVGGSAAAAPAAPGATAAAAASANAAAANPPAANPSGSTNATATPAGAAPAPAAGAKK